jgi:hypothetical protein
MKVVFATPSLAGPTSPYIAALEASIPLIVEQGWEEGYVEEIGNPYISGARSKMTTKALEAKADVIVYLDYDVSWDPEDLLKLINTEGDVVAGTYRIKVDEETYMGVLDCTPPDYTLTLRDDGCIKAYLVPAGFLKVTKAAIHRFMECFPSLCYRQEGIDGIDSVDLFNHGAHNGTWWGEDYAFSRRCRECGIDVWLIPDLNIIHHSGDKQYPGNFHEFLLRQPGGSKYVESDKTLNTIFFEHGSDKGSSGHYYGSFYESKLRQKRDYTLRLLEIGLSNNGNSKAPSLDAWQEYFPYAEIIGFDIQDFKHLKHSTEQGDQGNASDLEKLVNKYERFDVIIDDGSHEPSDQIQSFKSLYPILNPGGFYVIEDLIESRNKPLIDYLLEQGFAPEYFDSTYRRMRLLCITKE